MSKTYDNMAATREEARQKGGDELVAKLDAATAKERDFTKLLVETMDGMLAGLTDADERKLALVAMNESLSEAYGRAAVLYGAEQKADEAQIIVLAIRSLVNSINVAHADHEAEVGGVLELIDRADKKVAGEKGGDQ